MSKFEQDGADIQREARSIRQAIRAFKYSWNKCCYTGKHILCEKCAIAAAHNDALQRLEVAF